MYWLELYVLSHKQGTTTPLAWGLFICSFLLFVKISPRSFVDHFKFFQDQFRQESLFLKIYISFGLILSGIILSCGFYASLLPPHLPQETDAIIYHITLPRQHLLWGTFEHLRWSSADLFLLPIDFALAPFWLSTQLPNKIPQFLFFIGIIFVSLKWMMRLSQNRFWGLLLIFFAVLGSHNISIQLGTAMLGFVSTYLFIAALDSFLERRLFLCALESSFLFWSKPFVPFQVVLVVGVGIVLYMVLRKMGFSKIGWSSYEWFSANLKKDYRKYFVKFMSVFLVLSVLVAGPFLIKSLYYAGTPIYPFFTGVFKINPHIDENSVGWQSILEKSRQYHTYKDAYGHGRSFLDLVRHFWLVAVPEDGVNNSFDYPLGLAYLLCLGPFVYIFFRSLLNREFLILPWIVALDWGLWWLTSQQTRFLYVPILLMMLVVLSQRTMQTKMMRLGLLLALAMTSLSVVRAHKNDFGKSAMDVLREKDREFVLMSEHIKAGQPVRLQNYKAAFANFPVEVVGTDGIVLLQFEGPPSK